MEKKVKGRRLKVEGYFFILHPYLFLPSPNFEIFQA
jgi:hypothetical protein